MSEDKPKRERKMGKSTGYETDGESFWLAPGLVDDWGAIQDQERALDSIVIAMTNSVANARIHVEALRRKWWDRIYSDLELDTSVRYTFNRLERKLAPETTKESAEK